MKQLVRVSCPSCGRRAGWVERLTEPKLMHESSSITIDAGDLVFVTETIQSWSPVLGRRPRRRKLTTRLRLGFEVGQRTAIDGFHVVECRCFVSLRLDHRAVAEAIDSAYRYAKTINFVAQAEAAPSR